MQEIFKNIKKAKKVTIDTSYKTNRSSRFLTKEFIIDNSIDNDDVVFLFRDIMNIVNMPNFNIWQSKVILDIEEDKIHNKEDIIKIFRQENPEGNYENEERQRRNKEEEATKENVIKQDSQSSIASSSLSDNIGNFKIKKAKRNKNKK